MPTNNREREYSKEYYLKHREQRKQYYLAHKEQYAARCRKYDAAHRKERCEKRRKWYLNNKAKANEASRRTYQRRGWLKHIEKTYSITKEFYEELLSKQGGRCAICKKHPTKYRRMAVDHDHITKKVRGLLCHTCNKGLGMFLDDIGRLQAAIRYLEGVPSQQM